jgi:hypothetical protein
MRESRTYGSVRGALSNGRPYRDRQNFVDPDRTSPTLPIGMSCSSVLLDEGALTLRSAGDRKGGDPGTDGSQTLPWREMDSNPRSPVATEPPARAGAAGVRQDDGAVRDRAAGWRQCHVDRATCRQPEEGDERGYVRGSCVGARKGVRRGLSAGGNRIRTIGPAPAKGSSLIRSEPRDPSHRD